MDSAPSLGSICDTELGRGRVPVTARARTGAAVRSPNMLREKTRRSELGTAVHPCAAMLATEIEFVNGFVVREVERSASRAAPMPC